MLKLLTLHYRFHETVFTIFEQIIELHRADEKRAFDRQIKNKLFHALFSPYLLSWRCEAPRALVGCPLVSTECSDSCPSVEELLL